MLHPLFSEILSAAFPTLCGEARAPFPHPGDDGCNHAEMSQHVVNGCAVLRCEECHFETVLSSDVHVTPAAPRDERKGP